MTNRSVEKLSSRTSRKWAEGLTEISIRQAACWLANVGPSRYAKSDRAQAIETQLLLYAKEGLLRLGTETDQAFRRRVVLGTQKAFTPETELAAEPIFALNEQALRNLSMVARMNTDLRGGEYASRSEGQTFDGMSAPSAPLSNSLQTQPEPHLHASAVDQETQPKPRRVSAKLQDYEEHVWDIKSRFGRFPNGEDDEAAAHKHRYRVHHFTRDLRETFATRALTGAYKPRMKIKDAREWLKHAGNKKWASLIASSANLRDD